MRKKLTNTQVQDFLQDFKDRSEITILEEGKEKNELLESARKRGIIISKDDRDLGVIKTIYCFTSKANSNRARLPKDEFVKIFPQIVGRPMDYAHDRQFILGFYIDYKYILKDEKAIAYAVFFRGNYPKLWDKVKKFQKKKKLSSSFEIWSPEEARENLADGTYYLHNISIAGGALIFEEHGDQPAFKDAKVLSIAKNLNLEERIGKDCLVCASKYKEEEIIVAEDYFMKNVKENYKRLQEEKKKVEIKKTEPKVEPKKEEPKVEDKKPEVKAEPKPEEKKVEPQIGKIKCSNCAEELDYNGIDVRVKCTKCFAILNKEGVMQYPPQLRDFKMQCPACNIGNWLILSRTDKEAKLRCESCAKEYKIEFTQEDPQAKKILNKLNIIRKDVVYCYQCGHSIDLAGLSTIKDRNIKCPKCSIKFEFNIESKQYKKVSKIEEIKIDKIVKSTKTEKGGKEMDYNIELSKYHRYADVEKFEDADKTLPDSDFAVAVRAKDKKKGIVRKIRMYPIKDKAQIEIALTDLEKSTSQDTLKKLGIKIEDVKTKIMAKAKKLKVTKVEPKKVAVKKVEDKKVKAEIKKIEPKKKIEAKKEPEKKIEVKIEKAGDQKHDLELYALEDKIVKLKKELKTAKAEKEKEVKFYKENAKKIHDRKVELGDFAGDLSDEDIINDDKFETAQLKKKVAESKTIETANENVGDKHKDNEFYAEKHKKIDAIAYKETENTL